MSSRHSPSHGSRADARRRSRRTATGLAPDIDEPAEAPVAASGSRPPNLLTRLFPPAPPLLGKGDPLDGFTYSGPARARGLVSGAWLLVRHPLVWGVPAAGWAILQVLLLLAGREGMSAFLITLGQYGLLIGGGWFGWWRPWLFGLAAGIVGVAMHAVIVGVITVQSGQGLDAGLAVTASLTALLGLYGLVGAFAGFYGGYLRRRMAKPAPAAKGKRR